MRSGDLLSEGIIYVRARGYRGGEAGVAPSEQVTKVERRGWAARHKKRRPMRCGSSSPRNETNGSGVSYVLCDVMSLPVAYIINRRCRFLDGYRLRAVVFQ